MKKNIDWNEIKKNIREEISEEIYSVKKGFDIDGALDTLQYLTEIECEELEVNSFENLNNTLPKYLNNLLEKYDYENMKLLVSQFESFLKKLLYICDPSIFEDAKIDLMYGPLSYRLDLNPDVDLKLFKKISNSYDFTSLLGNENFAEHYTRTWVVRNIESHQSVKWTRKNITEVISSVLIAFVYTTNEFRNEILKDYKRRNKSNLNLNPYTQRIIHSYKEKHKLFVELSGKEDQRNKNEYSINIHKADTIGKLKSNTKKNCIVIWGEAGMGKTTTIENLAYIDAQNYKKDNSNKLPILLSLGLLSDKDLTIKDYLFEKIGLSADLGEELLVNGEINLYLDGVNEIPVDNKKILISKRRIEIKEFIEDYKDVFTIITDRIPEDSIRIFDAPYFILQKLNEQQIIEFTNNYTEGNTNLNDSFKDQMLKHPNLKNILKTPFYLASAIILLKEDGSLPENSGKIVKKFIEFIFKREKVDKLDAYFNSEKIKCCLRFLAFKIHSDFGTNSGMKENKVVLYFVKSLREMMYEYDPSYVLRICNELGILNREQNMIYFSHQNYLDYFLGEYWEFNDINPLSNA
jgi:hypothetical protein